MNGTVKSRRDFLRAAGMGLAAVALPRGLWAEAPRSDKRPNVIIIYTDDQGTFDLDCYGSDDLETPNVDGLAARGVRFTQFYAGSSVCSPSRAALLTGRYPHRAGVPGNAESHPSKFGKGEGLKEEQVTIAEVLKRAGRSSASAKPNSDSADYRTGHFGKWHLGFKPGPNGQGFDESVGFMSGCIDKWSHFSYGGAAWGSPPQWHDWYRNGDEAWESGTHSGDITVREASRFMEANAAAPFFMYVAFGIPHYPMQPYDKWREHYKDLPEPRRAYAAFVSTMDEQVGRLLAKVDELGLRENTLIIFQSDQGHSTEARCNYGGGNAGDLRGAKASLFEAGIRVPAIVSLPGRIPQGEARGQFCTSCDWLPTICEICGAEPPEGPVDGTSLVRVIQDAGAPEPHHVWHWQLGNQWAVREGDWKLLVNARDTTDGRKVQTLKEPFLANLAADPAERTNFASEHPDVVARLTGLHERWLADVAGE